MIVKQQNQRRWIMLEIVVIVYGVIVLVLIWRNTYLANRLRKQALLEHGTKTTFTSCIPLILQESFFFPVYVFWRGAKTFLEELEG
jgi:predicted Abi (CAAX) family protease